MNKEITNRIEVELEKMKDLKVNDRVFEPRRPNKIWGSYSLRKIKNPISKIKIRKD